MTTMISETAGVPPVAYPVDAETDVEVLHAVPQQFSICNEQTANWLVRRVCAARQYAERVRVFAEQERRRAEREEATLMFMFGRQLQEWARCQIATLGGRKKSIVLPGGTIGFRKKNPVLVVDDEQAVLTWAKKNAPAVVKVVETISKSSLNDHFTETGELPDGTHVEPGCEKFSIT